MLTMLGVVVGAGMAWACLAGLRVVLRADEWEGCPCCSGGLHRDVEAAEASWSRRSASCAADPFTDPSEELR